MICILHFANLLVTKKQRVEQALGDCYAEITYFTFHGRLFISFLKKKKKKERKKKGKKKQRGKTEEQNPNLYQCWVDFVLLHLYFFIQHRPPGSLSYMDSQNRLPLNTFNFCLKTCFTCSVHYVLINKSHGRQSFSPLSLQLLCFFTQSLSFFLFQLMSLKTLKGRIFLFWKLTSGWVYHHQWTDPSYGDYQWMLFRKLLLSHWNVILHSQLLDNNFGEVWTICGCFLPYLITDTTQRRANRPHRICVL